MTNLHTCLECAHFAGSKHDKGAFLFRRGSGYCLARIARKDWNVLQEIDRIRQCSDFSQAPPDITKRRKELMSRFRDEAIINKLTQYRLNPCTTSRRKKKQTSSFK